LCHTPRRRLETPHDGHTLKPVIGHMKTEGHRGRRNLKGRAGGAIDALLTAAGHNLRPIPKWLSRLSRSIPRAIRAAFEIKILPEPAC
jgi:hypothetical protein